MKVAPVLGHRVTLLTAPFCGICEMDCSEGRLGRSESCAGHDAPLARAVGSWLSREWRRPSDIAQALDMGDALGVERVGIVCDMLASSPPPRTRHCFAEADADGMYRTNWSRP